MYVAHEAAQGLAWFVVILFVVLGFVLRRDFLNEKKESESEYKHKQTRGV